jgi:cytochrome c oxidase cbb3-type subunit III
VSDFIHSGWAIFVAAGTIVSLVACLILLVIASRRQVMADDNTTGHVWDADLKEMNNPLPRWWMWLFVITVVFAAVYLAFYPGLGSNVGTLKWSSQGQYEAEQAKARATMAPLYASFVAMPAEELVKVTQAMETGQRLYLNNCAACHGSDGRGSKGFPNLTDSDWLGDSTLDAIKKTIVEGRVGMMPPMGAAVGTSDDVRNLANYVLSLSGSGHSDVAAQLGKSKFGTCAACHGADGKGNKALGAPNLTDRVWLHGGGEQAVIAMIVGGKNNVMPSQAKLMTPEQIHVLGAYVWGLSQATRVAAQ